MAEGRAGAAAEALRTLAAALLLAAPLRLMPVLGGLPLEAGLRAVSVTAGWAALAGAMAWAAAQIDPRWWGGGRRFETVAAVAVGFVALNVRMLTTMLTGGQVSFASQMPPPGIVAAVALHLVGVALMEEVVYRGALQSLLQRAFGAWPGGVFLAIFGASAPWALLHGHPDPTRLVPTVLAVQASGLLYGLVRWRWGTRASTTAHAAYNLGALLLNTRLG